MHRSKSGNKILSKIKGEWTIDNVNLDQPLLICIHVKEPTKYPKSTDQLSGGIWLVNKTGLQGLKLTNANILFVITRLIYNKSQPNLVRRTYWSKTFTIATKEGVHNYVVLGSIEAKLGRFYLILFELIEK